MDSMISDHAGESRRYEDIELGGFARGILGDVRSVEGSVVGDGGMMEWLE
jgi:hypothetical protein